MHVDVRSLVFDEPDAFREHVSAWGDAEMVPLSRGGLSLVWNQVAYDDMVIAHHGVTGSFADLCTINPRWWFFAICLAPTGTIWCGLDIEPGHLLIMAPGREYRSRMEQWDSLEIVLSDRLVEQAGLLDQAAHLAPEQCVLPLDHAQVVTFRALAQSLDAALTLEVELRDRLSYAIRERTLELLASALRRGSARRSLVEPVRRVARYDLAVRALALMDRSDQEPPALTDLADRLGTTARAIQYALKSGLGVSPYQYLLARRLQGARHDLLQHPTTVTMAAFDHGFENLGRFANQYARLFGERPSETLRRIRVAGAAAA
jgi:methylphosphotriester-DNA--protein-cysteine methyltransferase